jgi:hypothetical protein
MTRADYDDPFSFRPSLAVHSYEEVAAALGLSPGTVRDVERGALRKLRKALAADGFVNLSGVASSAGECD